jgi:tRNA(Arg) A34 adenosine deaminase TadA
MNVISIDKLVNNRIVNTLRQAAVDNDINMRHKLAAGIVYKKSLIAVGLNSFKTHPLMLLYGKNDQSVFLHAEIDVIKNALKVITLEELEQCDLYVYRVKREGQYSSRWINGLSRPCAGCMRAIEAFGVRGVFYTTDHNLNWEHMSREYLLSANAQ